jgi:hypothetical protein
MSRLLRAKSDECHVMGKSNLQVKTKEARRKKRSTVTFLPEISREITRYNIPGSAAKLF